MLRKFPRVKRAYDGSISFFLAFACLFAVSGLVFWFLPSNHTARGLGGGLTHAFDIAFVMMASITLLGVFLQIAAHRRFDRRR
jgi:hypothetical protein